MQKKGDSFSGISNFFSKILLSFFVLSLFVGPSEILTTIAHGEAQSQAHISAIPQRIVIFPLFAEEMLLEMVGPERIVYVGHEYLENGEAYSPTMELTKSIEGRYWNMSIGERILAHNPDLIVLEESFSHDYAEIWPELYEASIPFLFLETPKNIEDIRNIIFNLGNEVGASEKAIQMVKDMDIGLARIAEIVSTIPEEQRVRGIHYEYWDGEDDNSSKWFRQNSFAMVALAAGVIPEGPNTTDFISVNADDLLAEQSPDMITFDYTDYDTDGSVYETTGLYHEEFINAILSNPKFSNIPAIKKHAIFPIRLSESQFIVQSVIELAQLAYPELFAENQ